jgi:hypothetical protein
VAARLGVNGGGLDLHGEGGRGGKAHREARRSSAGMSNGPGSGACAALSAVHLDSGRGGKQGRGFSSHTSGCGAWAGAGGVIQGRGRGASGPGTGSDEVQGLDQHLAAATMANNLRLPLSAREVVGSPRHRDA